MAQESEDPRSVLERSRRLVQARKDAQESEQLLEKLPQGHGSGLDADMVDGLHAAELLGKARASGMATGGAGGSGGDMTKAVYDTNNDGVVDNSQKLEGSTKAQVQDHAPKAHTHPVAELTDHNKTVHDALNINADTVDGAHLSDLATDMELAAHAALESVHHTKFTMTEHDTTVRHSLGTVVPHDALASLTEKSHTSLTDKGTNTHAQLDTHLAASAPHSGHEQTVNKGAVSGYAPLDAAQLVPLANIPATLTGKDADTVDGSHGAALEKVANKDAASGYAGLSAASKLAASQMPTGKVAITLTFSVPDTLTTGQKKQRLLAPCAITLTKVRLVVDTAPTGADLIVDVHTGTGAGTTIFTTQGNRPTIAAGNKTGVSVAPDVTSIAEGDEFSVYIDAIGTTIAGSDLTIEVVGTQAVAFS